MAKIILFNKPYDVLTQFRPEANRLTLADFIDDPSLRVAGRLDRDSEGLLLLTNDGHLNAQLTQPRHKAPKTYWVQVEGTPHADALQRLQDGVLLNDGLTLPAQVEVLEQPTLWERNPPIRTRLTIPTCWLSLTITEGRNRQVRRMTAAVGLPTLRLVRVKIGEYTLDNVLPGQWRRIDIPDKPLKPKIGR